MNLAKLKKEGIEEKVLELIRILDGISFGKGPLGAPHDYAAPRRMRTRIRITKPETGQNVCFGYTAANIFNYIAKYKCKPGSGSNYEQLAKMCREQAWIWSRLPLFQVLHDFDKIIEIFAPYISHPTSYGKPPWEEEKEERKRI